MNKEDIKNLLKAVKDNKIPIDEAMKTIEDLPFKDLGFAKIDNHREIRVGYPEVIYCAGKTIEQVKSIIEFMLTKENNILATRVTEDMYKAVREICKEVSYNKLARTMTIKKREEKLTDSYIVIVSAGTSDLPVVEEAAETAMIFGNRVEKIVDVGVAGIHRLFSKLDIIRGAKVVIVVAGMEGALASVVGGLVDKPVIAVPTSIGYGANFKGLSALLSMLNSCASGVTVVNIDNGFGAAYNASIINKL
ncbi:1-(5-phosphoribosyl)-5-amino-4-imidazole-carboxylate carboxylase [Clostridium pasteurianum]|nr:nickel pincer cofactor biosynthesis protein LarB [Clostridium pasteurianum]AOZ74115.1 1-(5-phosphoribosyl)-5-amino-4-imidazole-carboxylate carboxylase [Clostridium pasteurianum DSM 525 = ATCC 6013]AOZ77912.1 1-(5-phosphoribosyl)-5-amino-4-imidazole-carboxylate carboxylase [Clostridium pasteurianum]ELP61278.1 1-(5-phosphoribosyl)-5-amino-4-imidazole-carboxylate (AIR) carboxylase [Clostridium pasteurianum DSM 525 = ATCC 6013]OMH21656.1 1-(5-phosphoribosyl)-5-amino-4-imidazole-carboxylate carbo